MIARIFAGFLLFAACAASAATKYVSPNGSALWAACTTEETPCAISTAQTSAAAGDVIMLMDGRYSVGINTATNGASGNPITWRAVNARKAILAGYASGQATPDKVVIVDNQWHVFDGLTVEVQTGPGSANTYGVYILATTSTTIFKNGECYFGGDESAIATNQAICIEPRSASIIDNNYIHNSTYGVYVFAPTAAFAVTVSENRIENMVVGDYEDSDCMAIGGAASYNWDGLAFFDHNDCSGYRDDGIDMSTQQHVTALRNEIHAPTPDENANSSCIKFGFSSAAQYNKAYRNHCFDLQRYAGQHNYGIIMTGPSYGLAYSNVITGAYHGVAISQYSGAGGIGNTLLNNTITGCLDDCVQIYTGATSSVVENNALSSSGGYAISVASGLSATGATNIVDGGVGGDGNFVSSGDIEQSPSLVSTDNATVADDFMPKPGSPAIRGGTCYLSTGCVYPDFRGYRARVPPNIGAFQQGLGSP